MQEQAISKLESTVTRLGDALNREWRKQPKSEKGSSGSGGSGGGNNNGGDGGGGKGPPETPKEIYQSKIKEKDPALDFKNMAKQHGLDLKEFWSSLSSESQLIPPDEDLMGSGVAKVFKKNIKYQHDSEEKSKLFGKSKGLHSSYDKTKHYELEVVINEVTALHETLRDESQEGKGGAALSHRKTDPYHYPNFQITTRTLISLVTLHCEFKVPIKRLEKMLAPAIFSSSNISRWICSAAEQFLPIYLTFPDQLGRGCDYIKTDDTNTHVLELVKHIKSGKMKSDKSLSKDEWDDLFSGLRDKADDQCKPDLLSSIIKRLGRISGYASGKGAKKKVNLTLVSGKSNRNDWRSTICFFRTHCGQAGNLISQIYEPFAEEDSDRTLSIQSDCSPQNHIRIDLRHKFKMTYAGCTDHARRPFARYASEDENLAYTMLLHFLNLYNLEKEIKCGPLTEKRILEIRKQGWGDWQKILLLAMTVIAGKIDAKVLNRKHYSESNLYGGCFYIVNNYDALTSYIGDAELSISNGFSERKLRPEKMFVDSSKFSFSELGSATKDIHQTMMSTCLSAGQDPAEYYSWVIGIDAEKIKKDPEAFTPYAFALMKANKSAKADQPERPEQEIPLFDPPKKPGEPLPTLH